MTDSFETLIMFKPDARDIVFRNLPRERLLHEVVAGLLVSCGLEIEQYSRKQLCEEEVRTLYEKALAPNPRDEAIWGTAWKKEVVEHMTSGPVDSYLLHDPGSNGLDTTRAVKNWLRAHYGRQDDVVKNIAHVPDPDEFNVSKSVLFSYE
jgi:nucleoside diphosphate kinase